MIDCEAVRQDTDLLKIIKQIRDLQCNSYVTPTNGTVPLSTPLTLSSESMVQEPYTVQRLKVRQPSDTAHQQSPHKKSAHILYYIDTTLHNNDIRTPHRRRSRDSPSNSYEHQNSFGRVGAASSFRRPSLHGIRTSRSRKHLYVV
jgi:arylamine N-acetyltransferase